MKRASTTFLQFVLVLIAIGTIALLLWEPTVEGVNKNATLLQMYLDPFILYAYIGSIPFFVALYQAFALLRYIGRNEVFTKTSVRSLRNIKYAALVQAAAILAADAWLVIHARLLGGTDDPAGAVMLGMVATFASLVVATAAAVFERLLQTAVDMKSENDLTV